MGRRLVPVLAVAVVAVACSSSDGDDATVGTTIPDTTAPTPTTEPGSTTSTTTAPTTTTTEAPATTTTLAPTTAAPTTIEPAPTTTVLDLESLLTPEAVIAAAQAADAAFVECGLQLPDCDTSVFDETHTGPQLSQVVSRRTQDAAAGNRIRNTENRRLIISSVRIEGLESGDLGEIAARTEECVYDETVVFRLQPDGTEEIQNDDTGTVTYDRRYVIDDGRWKRANAEVTSQILGSDMCP